MVSRRSAGRARTAAAASSQQRFSRCTPFMRLAAPTSVRAWQLVRRRCTRASDAALAALDVSRRAAVSPSSGHISLLAASLVRIHVHRGLSPGVGEIRALDIVSGPLCALISLLCCRGSVQGFASLLGRSTKLPKLPRDPPTASGSTPMYLCEIQSSLMAIVDREEIVHGHRGRLAPWVCEARHWRHQRGGVRACCCGTQC